MSSTVSGRIVKEISGFFTVELDDGTRVVCRLRGRLMEEAQSSDIAAIGDRVVITQLEDGTGTIESVAERHSALSRAVRTEGNRGAGAAEREHVIVANADQVFIVFAAAQPSPALRQVDRFVVAAEKGAIDDIVLVLNKIDLDTNGDSTAAFANYTALGYGVIHTSALRGDGLEELKARLPDRISFFTGPSGVGKTSLLNALQPGLQRSTRSVSRYHQEGVHTTRDSELIRLTHGGYLADTPGLRYMTAWDVEPDELDAYFREIAPLVSACRFGDCTHSSEPGCAVRLAVEAGRIRRSRYDSYLSLRAELDAAYMV